MVKTTMRMTVHYYNPAFCWIISVPPSFERVVSIRTWLSIESLDQAFNVASESEDQVIVEKQVRLDCCKTNYDMDDARKACVQRVWPLISGCSGRFSRCTRVTVLTLL